MAGKVTLIEVCTNCFDLHLARLGRGKSKRPKVEQGR